MQFNGLLFTSYSEHAILEEKYYQCIEMVFPCIRAYVDKANKYIESPELTKVNTIYSELLSELYSRSSNMNTDFKLWSLLLNRKVRALKDTIFRLFEDFGNVSCLR